MDEIESLEAELALESRKTPGQSFKPTSVPEGLQPQRQQRIAHKRNSQSVGMIKSRTMAPWPSDGLAKSRQLPPVGGGGAMGAQHNWGEFNHHRNSFSRR